jgi:hypothetical protein
LKQGGLIIIGLVDKNSPLGKVYEGLKDEDKFYRIATFYSTAEVMDCLQQAQFGQIEAVQTVFGHLESMQEIQPSKEGHGEGGFVAIKSVKLT